MKQLESAKGEYPVFQDKTLGPIANRLLQAELATNRTEPVELIVERIASDVQGLSAKSTRKYVKEKVDQRKKIPGAVRSKDGRIPAITVQKPKTIQEAGKAYQAWRKSAQRLQRG